MSRRKIDSLRFAMGMLIYALVFLVLLFVVVRFFWAYMADYEASRPIHAIEAYIESFDSAHIRALAADTVAKRDAVLQSEEEANAAVETLFRETLSYAKKSTESTDRRMVYAISAGDRLLGTVELQKAEEGSFGRWYVTGESFDFSALFTSRTLTVPEGYTVLCNGHALDGAYVEDAAVKAASLADLYAEGYALPYLVRYRVEGILGDFTLSAAAPGGEAQEVPEEVETLPLTDTCTPAERERLLKFFNGFLPLYVQCLANSNHDAYGNYQRIKPYLLAGSSIDQRISNAIEGLYYSHSRGDVLHDEEYHVILKLDENEFLVDMSYKLDTTGNAGVVTTDTSLLVIIRRVKDNDYRAVSLYVY